MLTNIRNATFKHGYLIITAAWLYTISFIFSNYFSYNSGPDKVKQNLENRIHTEEERFNLFANDTNRLSSLIFDSASTVVELALEKGKSGVFVYKKLAQSKFEELYWSTNKMTVPNSFLYTKSTVQFVNSSNGQFLLSKKNVRLRNKDFLIVNVLPIKWSYFIENKYFSTDFVDFPGLDEQYAITNNLTHSPIYNQDGLFLFSIDLKDGKQFVSYDIITIFFRIAAILLLLLFIHAISKDLIDELGFKKGFLFLIVSVILLRLISYLFPFPFDYSKLSLFDPSIYASNFLHPSLGDLFLNAVLFYWIMRFVKNNYSININIPTTNSSFQVKAVGIFIYTCTAFFIVGIIQSLIRDAKISFDVTNFFSLTIYSTISIVILCFLALGFFYLSQLILVPILSQKQSLGLPIVIVILSGFINILFQYNASQIGFQFIVIGWLLLFMLLLRRRASDLKIQIIKSSFFIFWVMLFAMSIAALVIHQNRLVEFEQRKRIAEKLAIQSDPSGENLLKIAATNFNNNFLSENFDRFHESEYANKFIKDSLINQNFSGYLNKYDTRIYTFDSLFHPLFNEDSLNYSSIKTIVLNQSVSTDVPNLFTYENNFEGFNYIYQVTVERNNYPIGYLFIIMNAKRYKSEALYPELFNQSQDVIADLNNNYAYAIYNKGRIINHFNNYNFPTQLSSSALPQFEFVYKMEGDFSELWFNAGNDRQVVVVKRNTWVIEAVTLFAYLFCSFLFIIFIFHIGALIIKAKFKLDELKKLLRFNIRTQIQATIIFVSVFSFLVIGIATISFFIYRYNRSNEERLSKSIQVMANELNAKVVSILALDDEPNNSGVKNELEQVIAEISDLHNVDINYYNAQGDLIISTQPYIYNKNLLSKKMDPVAYIEMHRENRIRFIQSETIGSFGYLSIYIPLMTDTGETYGYLNIPYLNSQIDLNQEISGFLATLINLNAFIFLLAGAIAFFITNQITASLSLIGATMKKMNLGVKNQQIDWNRDDEIGVLVNEYNNMVRKLELSAASLAKTEREGAWREMARQVAHEIKNPLTPMKLSIQYLQHAIQQGAPNVNTLSANLAKTLIEQIDQLAKIAGDFSQFANIGIVKLEKFSVANTIESLQNLYAGDSLVNFQVIDDSTNSNIESDKVQINRLFMNLIQNGVEAGKELNGKAKIEIQLNNLNGFIEITIRDYSGGIPAAMKENMFRPNFTTKSAGTGLGLAICKGIVEQANGTIHYQTVDGVGTTFTVQLPTTNIN
ncbi:HAMP domain-containing sensor histidine kinase [Sediminibacterium sp.]|uniref:sensor histidine kinase n=1 Tax=Sediminibacterium sp. TaxID=1917865 RepID=UPI0025E85695|nr:HAMP domain-containing sensor histidine kinase [Sediminibacterium sp.]MBT9484882.1 HAMP domain-containing histidine kinase [Sediminibacterium sp.]